MGVAHRNSYKLTSYTHFTSLKCNLATLVRPLKYNPALTKNTTEGIQESAPFFEASVSLEEESASFLAENTPSLKQADPIVSPLLFDYFFLSEQETPQPANVALLSESLPDLYKKIAHGINIFVLTVDLVNAAQSIILTISGLIIYVYIWTLENKTKNTSVKTLLSFANWILAPIFINVCILCSLHIVFNFVRRKNIYSKTFLIQKLVDNATNMAQTEPKELTFRGWNVTPLLKNSLTLGSFCLTGYSSQKLIVLLSHNWNADSLIKLSVFLIFAANAKKFVYRWTITNPANANSSS